MRGGGAVCSGKGGRGACVCVCEVWTVSPWYSEGGETSGAHCSMRDEAQGGRVNEAGNPQTSDGVLV